MELEISFGAVDLHQKVIFNEGSFEISVNKCFEIVKPTSELEQVYEVNLDKW
jgi:hypothetical protein